MIFCSQILCKEIIRQENADFEQEYCSFNRRHVLEYGIQDGDPGREGYIYYTYYTYYDYYTSYTYYSCYTHYTYYSDYITYFQVLVELGIADHIWLDKRVGIAQTVDALANMRRLDGSPLPHERYSPPVNFFAAKGSRKYWITKKTPALG